MLMLLRVGFRSEVSLLSTSVVSDVAVFLSCCCGVLALRCLFFRLFVDQIKTCPSVGSVGYIGFVGYVGYVWLVCLNRYVPFLPLARGFVCSRWTGGSIDARR